MQVVLREATAGDAEAIGRISVESWRVGYAGLMAESVLDSMDAGGRAAAWLEYGNKPEFNTIVAELDGEVVAFAGLRLSAGKGDGKDVGNMPTFYLLPCHWRKGIGGLLWRRVLEVACERGFRTLTVWVLESNQRARSFYESVGLLLDGATKVDTRLTGHELHEVRYRIEVPFDHSKASHTPTP
jgi:GNAT superfamily N-acetyltransferase